MVVNFYANGKDGRHKVHQNLIKQENKNIMKKPRKSRKADFRFFLIQFFIILACFEQKGM